MTTNKSIDKNTTPNIKHIYSAILKDKHNERLTEHLLQMAALSKQQQDTGVLLACLQLLLLTGYKSPIVWSDMACLLSQQNRHDEAFYYFTLTKDHEQLHTEQFNRLFIKSHWQLNAYSHVINFFEKYIKTPVADYFMMRNIGMSYFHLELYAKANLILSQVFTKMPEDGTLKNILERTKIQNKSILNILGLPITLPSQLPINAKVIQESHAERLAEIQNKLRANSSQDTNNQSLDITRDQVLATIWKHQDQVVLEFNLAKSDTAFWNAHNVGMSKALLLGHPMAYAITRFYQDDNPLDESLHEWAVYHKSLIADINKGNISVMLNSNGLAPYNLNELLLPYPIQEASKFALTIFNEISHHASNPHSIHLKNVTKDELLVFSNLYNASGLIKFGDFEMAKTIYFELLASDAFHAIICLKLLRLPASKFSASEIDLLENEILKNTDNTFLWYELGKFLSKINEERAIRVWEKLASIQKPRYQSLLQAGEVYFKSEDFNKANELLDIAQRINPLDAECAILRANAQIQSGDNDQGFSTLETAINNGLDHPILVARFANQCIEQEKFDSLQKLVIHHGAQIKFKAPTWMSWAAKFERHRYFTGMIACLDQCSQSVSTEDQLSSSLEKWINKRKHLLKSNLA